MDVRDEVALVEQRHVRDVRRLVPDMTDAGRRDGARLKTEHEIDDGQIVNREIPEDVHVVLKQPEVHTHRVVVIDLAELAARHERGDLADGAGVDERVIHHQGQRRGAPPPR